MTLPAGSQIGKYVVQKKLAEGGMAEIYLATSQGAEGFEKEIVIKRIRSFLASDPGFVDMFIAEARLASRLNHANVVQIFDFEKHEDTYYLAMEYVRGCTLWDLRKKCQDDGEPMPAVLVAQIGAEVARGLHYAHRLKVNGEPLYLVHRDVTPHNVLISFDGAVKLTDFGIAKAGNKLTSPGMLKGKFAYMSPEQSRGENVDARTDVFALGIVLWEMLTGIKLFNGDSELAVLRAVQQSTITPPARLIPNVPEELSEVVMKALEREPEERYQTAGELERALVQCVLNHAQSPDDTDVSAFMRRVYLASVPSALALPALPVRPERTQEHERDKSKKGGSKQEPTKVQSGRKNSGSHPVVSPDEDVHAPTHLLPDREESPASKASPALEEGFSPSLTKSTSKRLPALVVPREPAPEAEPVYPATVALPVPKSAEPVAPVAPVAAEPELPKRVEPAEIVPPPQARPRSTGLWVGLGVGALVAVAGVGVLLSGRGQGSETSPGPTPPPAVAAAKPAELPPIAVTPPPPPEVPDAGTGSNPEPVAVAAPKGTEPAPGSSKPEGVRPAVPAPATGSLIIRAVPYATVLVNGKSMGEVQGQRTFKLAPGSYQVSFRHPKGTKTESVTISANGTSRSEFRAR